MDNDNLISYEQNIINDTYDNISDTDLLKILDWNYISKNIHITNKNIEIYKDHLIWQVILQRSDLTIDFLKKYMDFVNGFRYTLGKNKSLINNIDFLNCFSDHIDWKATSEAITINDYILEKYYNKLCWNKNIISQMSEKQLEKYKNYIPIIGIALYGNISVSYIKKNIVSVYDIYILVKYRKLSNEIIEYVFEEYSKKFDGGYLAYEQMNNEFFKYLFKNNEIPDNLLEKYDKYINPITLYTNCKLSEDYFINNFHKIRNYLSSHIKNKCDSFKKKYLIKNIKEYYDKSEKIKIFLKLNNFEF